MIRGFHNNLFYLILSAALADVTSFTSYSETLIVQDNSRLHNSFPLTLKYYRMYNVMSEYNLTA